MIFFGEGNEWASQLMDQKESRIVDYCTSAAKQAQQSFVVGLLFCFVLRCVCFALSSVVVVALFCWAPPLLLA